MSTERNEYNSDLAYAIYKSNLGATMRAIEQGANINALDTHGLTHVMHAASGNEIEILKLLMDNGADVNIRNRYGYTAAMMCAEHDYVECMKILIDAGCDLEIKDEDGESALNWAANHLSEECYHLLAKSGANLKAISRTDPELYHELKMIQEACNFKKISKRFGEDNRSLGI